MFIAPINTNRISQNYRCNLLNNRENYTNIKYRQTSDSAAFTGKLPKLPPAKLFDNYTVSKILTGNDVFNVHNSQIFAKMRTVYDSKQFESLFDFAKLKGVFNLNIDPKTHYAATSMIDPKENPLMGKLVWVTDSARYMPIIKDLYPEAAVPLIENLSKYYKKQERNFNKIINDPIQYEFNHDWSPTAKNGIGHVFNPKSMTTHKWFARTRLDSPGLYLQNITDLITDGLNGAEYGYKKASEISQNSIDAISNVTSYLKAVAYPFAKDTGAWEEKTFNITPSSDVAIINEGFRTIINLMYSKTCNPEILKVRQRLLNSKNGEVFKDENALRQLLKFGENRIIANSMEEVPGERALDGALSFIPHTEKFSYDAVEDARQIISRMKRLEPEYRIDEENIEEKLVRENGTLRYLKDRYLNMASGHKINKSKELPKNTEAQWFMTSDISKSYGMAVKRLLDKLETEGVGRYTDEPRRLLKEALRKETEYINRAYGRITGENTNKANGKPCPPFQVPEAYQAVRNSGDEIVFVPGTNTPLGWAQASLYDASKLFIENLKRIEKLYI